MQAYHSASGSEAEDLFIELFSEIFGIKRQDTATMRLLLV